jgi:hypothetical protein
MQKFLLKAFSFLVLLGLGLNAQAGHLFTQNSLNTEINLTAGFCIDLPQRTPWEETGTSGDSNFNLDGDFGSGDVMRVSLEGLTYVFDFDSMPSGWAANSSTVFSSPNDPQIAALAPTPPFTWQVCSLAGDFTLTGFRLYTANGTIDGTNTDTVNQGSVIPITGGGPVPVFSPIHLVLLIVGLIGMVGARRKFLKGQQA